MARLGFSGRHFAYARGFVGETRACTEAVKFSLTARITGKWLACQSMDNKVCVFDVLNRFKFMRKKTFKGHMVCCQLFSVSG